MDLADLMQNLKVVNSKEALALLPDTVEVSRIRLRYRYSVYCLEEQTLQLIRNYQRFHYGFRRHVKQLEAEALAQAATLQAQQEEEQKQKRLSTLNLPSLEHLLLPPANSKNNLLSSSSSSTHVVLPPVPQLPLLPRDPIRPLNSLKVGHGGQEFHASVTKLRRMSRRITPPPKAQQVRNNWSAEQLSIGIIGASGMLGRRLLDRLVKHPEDFSLQDLIDEDAGITSTANRSTPQTADTRNGNSLTVPNTAAVSRSTQSLQVEQQKQRLPYQIYAACRVIPDFLEPYRQIPGVRLFDNNEAVMSRCQVVIICCPRHQFKSVMQTIRPQLTREKVILVVGAGWTGNDGWGMRRIQSVFGDGDRALTLSTSLDYVMIDKLTKGLKDFFKSTGTSYPLATWPTEKEKQTYETFMDLMCNQFAFICTLAELDIRQPAIQRIIGRALRVKRLIVNDWVPVEQRSQAELANRSKYEDEELLDLDNRPLLQAWERYAWSSWLVERETPVIAVDWNYVDPSSTRPSTANTSSGTRPTTANAVPIVVTSING